MLRELLVGTVVALAAPQAPAAQETADRFEVDVPPIEVAVPDIVGSVWVMEFPAVRVRVPALRIHLPVDVGVAWDGFDHGFHHGWNGDDAREWGVQDVQLDTTFGVDPSAVLSVRNHAGEIIVRVWDRSEVRVRASHSRRDRVKIFASDRSVSIKSEARHGHPDIVDYEITAPAAMPLDLWGFYTDISVNGARGGLRIETLNGDVSVRNSSGELSLRSVEGDVVVQSSGGRLEVNNIENEISVLGFEGEVYLESIDGDIRLQGITSNDVEAKTVDGDVHYDGAIQDAGRYRLTTHDGDVHVFLSENVNATVSVATFDGEFEASFPIELRGAQATRRFSFVLGDGAARLELHSFDGDIRLSRRQ